MSSKTVVVALGGNAITREFEEGSITQQFANTRRSLSSVVELIARGDKVVISHGNGPQVGNALLRVEETRHLVPPLPLGVIVADLEGGMGYMIEQCLQNKLNERQLLKPIVTLVTQILVDKDDPSIANPTKFVGPFYKQEQIKELETKRGWTIKEDPGRGYRRVVPSPLPREILSKGIIRNLLDQDVVVIAAGGGGIPVYREESGWLEGVDGVIDKDLAAAILAHDIGAEELFILTAVDKVAIDYKKPQQRNLDHLTVKEAKDLMELGHFPKGSMGPKIEAAILFLEQGGKRVVITSIENAARVVKSGGGTVLTRN